MCCCKIAYVSINWQIKEVTECESTFNVARKLPPWSVVNCESQTKGRGRFNRAWYGTPGGLWATYNVPIEARADLHWGVLPLVAGAAIMETLSKYNIKGLRLRWPNDVLVGRAKLAGILVERPSANMASIGIGINMHNDIRDLSGSTTDPVVRLEDLVRTCPTVRGLRAELGDKLAEVLNLFMNGGLQAIKPMLEKAWGNSRPVVAITDNERICGFFCGVAHDGSPVLRRPDGSTITVPGITVNRLKELI